jgi:hypothetical protein
MLLVNEPVRQVEVPASSLAIARGDRGLAWQANKVAALRRFGVVAELRFTDDQGNVVPAEQARALRGGFEAAVRELAVGRLAHVRQTLATIAAANQTAEQQVDGLLATVYEAHGGGQPGDAILDAFLDPYETWQRPEGVARIDLLFDRLALERAPESLGLLLLATTRLTRHHFVRRAAFVERLRAFLVGRGGRTERDVEKILQGLVA